MNIHSEIRKQVLANLQGKIEGIERFINGRPVFADVEKELPAIAVFIDEVMLEEMTMCGNQGDGVLTVGIYLPFYMTEDALDEVAEIVTDMLAGADISVLETFRLAKFSYSYDENQAAWISANLHYEFQYQ